MNRKNLKHEWQLETSRPPRKMDGKTVMEYVCRICRKILRNVPKMIAIKAPMWDEQCDAKVPKRPARKPKFTPVE